MKDLQVVRQKSNVFQGKHGFITARDLLRWASRQPGSTQELAEEGYMLLAERLRKPDERAVVQEVLERQCGSRRCWSSVAAGGVGGILAVLVGLLKLLVP